MNRGSRWLPGLALFRDYRREWLGNDLAAGLVLTAMLIPVGMGYAETAGLPAVTGLYATIIPLLVYTLVGPSRVLILGPDSALSGMIASAILLPLAGAHPGSPIELAALLSCMVGVICLIAGWARLGFVTELLSKPVRIGYLNGIALTVICGQLVTLTGMPKLHIDGTLIQGHSLWLQLQAVLSHLFSGDAHWMTTLVGVATLVIIKSFQRWRPRWPGILIATLLSSVLVWWLDSLRPGRIAIIGAIPSGFPSFALPGYDWSHLTVLIPQLLPTALAIALVAIANVSVLSRTFAEQFDDDVDPDQELRALGWANFATGFFQGFAISASASRTPVAIAAGAKTRLAGAISAVSMGILIVVWPQLLGHVPRTVLAAIVIAACLSLMEWKALHRLFQLSPGEGLISVICLGGVMVMGVVEGIFLSVAIALGAFVWKAWRPYDTVLGRIAETKGYHDISRHPEARTVPGLILFRWDAPLFFANQELFRQRVLQLTRANPDAPAVRWLVVAAEPITDIDITAADMLEELDRHLSRQGVTLGFAELKGPAKDRLRRNGLYAKWGEQRFFPTLGKAVDAYLAATGVAWTDWEDRKA